MPGPTYEEQAKATYSTNMISKLTGLDRRTVDKYLESEGVETVGSGKANEYCWLDAIKAFLNCSKGQSSADRRNEAQARKAEVETDIILQKYIKIEEVEAPTIAVYSVINREIQGSPLPDEAKERIVERMRVSLRELGIDDSLIG